MNVSAIVHRKTRDVVRDAAEDLLRERSVGLTAIDRAELWTFDVDDSPAAAEEAVRRILDDTTLVVNPNIHRYSLAAPPPADDDSTRLVLTVRDRVDPKGAAVLRSVRERLGLTNVTGVTRAVQWMLAFDSDEVSVRALGREITGESERGAGLLANPHAQDTEWRVVSR